jgi:hypothetical protein
MVYGYWGWKVHAFLLSCRPSVWESISKVSVCHKTQILAFRIVRTHIPRSNASTGRYFNLRCCPDILVVFSNDFLYSWGR